MIRLSSQKGPFYNHERTKIQQDQRDSRQYTRIPEESNNRNVGVGCVASKTHVYL